MKHLLLSVALLCTATIASAQSSTPSWQWGKILESATSTGATSTANAVTPDGGALWLGTVSTSASVTDVNLSSNLLFSTQSTAAAGLTATNLSLIKTDSDGAAVWELHTLGGDCSNNNGGVAVTADGGCIFATILRHADVAAMPTIKVIDGTRAEFSLDWTASQRSYSILAGKTDAKGGIKWMRLYHVDTTPGPAAAGNTADFWSNCINLGNIAVDTNDNIYMIMNLRNPLSVPSSGGADVKVSVQNNTEWTGDSQKAAGDFVLLSLDSDGYYRNHLNIQGNCQVAYGQRVAVSGDRVYAQGYITGNGNTLRAGDFELTPSTVMSPTLFCTDTNLNVKWAKCYAGATVAGKYGFQYTNLNVVGNTLWMTGMFNLSFGDGTNTIASTQGAVREGLILKLNAENGSWLGACTSRSGNFNQPSAVANTGLTGYINLIQPNENSNRIYVFGYVMNATVGVFLREYDASTLTPNLTDGQHNIITGGGAPTACCATFDSNSNSLYVAARGNKAFTPLGGDATEAPASWGVYISRFNLPTDVETGITPPSNCDDAPIEYFNLEGQKVANPSSGLYIRRQGTRVEKILIK